MGETISLVPFSRLKPLRFRFQDAVLGAASSLDIGRLILTCPPWLNVVIPCIVSFGRLSSVGITVQYRCWRRQYTAFVLFVRLDEFVTARSAVVVQGRCRRRQEVETALRCVLRILFVRKIQPAWSIRATWWQVEPFQDRLARLLSSRLAGLSCGLWRRRMALRGNHHSNGVAISRFVEEMVWFYTDEH